MQLVEVSLAAVLFAAAAGSSLQLGSAAASSSQSTALRQQLQERIELDRLHLQAHWRQNAAGLSCLDPVAGLIARAADVPPPPQLQRQLLPAADGEALLVQWSAGPPGEPPLQRHRWLTPAGLGLCVEASGASAPAPVLP